MRLSTPFYVISAAFLVYQLVQAIRAAMGRRAMQRAEAELEQLVLEGRGGLPWDTDIVGSLSLPLEKRARAIGLASLSEVELTIAGPLTARALLGNGGFAYWYGHYDRKATLAVADALTRLGLPAAAAAMRDSVCAFPNNLPPDDVEERRRVIETLEGPLDALPAETVYSHDEELNKRVLEYARVHREELLARHPETAATFARLDALDARLPDALHRLSERAPASLDRHAFDLLLAERDYTIAIRMLLEAGDEDTMQTTYRKDVDALARELNVEESAGLLESSRRRED
jgi:hypothetical protein